MALVWTKFDLANSLDISQVNDFSVLILLHLLFIKLLRHLQVVRYGKRDLAFARRIHTLAAAFFAGAAEDAADELHGAETIELDEFE
jgi:hypothetical protein